MAAWTDGLLRRTRRSEELGQVLKHLTPSGARADLPTHFDDPQEDAFTGMDRRTRRVAETLLARRRLFHRARRSLRDPATTALIFVLTPEKLPILETLRARDALVAFELPVRGLVVNRVLPDEAEGAFLARRKQGERRYLEQIEVTFTEVHGSTFHCWPRRLRASPRLTALPLISHGSSHPRARTDE
jgi:arsenite/tail-anchored protein-transporting ATPase